MDDSIPVGTVLNKYLKICICINAIAVGIPRNLGKRERNK
jgi:hypothetical protein